MHLRVAGRGCGPMCGDDCRLTGSDLVENGLCFSAVPLALCRHHDGDDVLVLPRHVAQQVAGVEAEVFRWDHVGRFLD